MCLYPFETVLVQFKESKKVLLTTSLQHLKRKVQEVFALDVAESILVQKYHAEFGEAVAVDHDKGISKIMKETCITVLCFLKLKMISINRWHISGYRYMFASVSSSFNNLAFEINIILV